MNPEAPAYYSAMLATDTESRDPDHCESPESISLFDKLLSSNSHVRASSTIISKGGDDSDETLLSQVSDGNREALSALFQRYARKVLSVARRILKDDSEAEDLLQDLFVFLFQKATLFDRRKASAASWIIQMTYHRALDRRRYLQVRQHYDARELNTESQHGARQISIDEIAGRALLHKLREELSAEQLRTLELHFFEGYTLTEITSITGETYGSVRHHYYRGLERLRSHVFRKKHPSGGEKIGTE